MEIGPYHLDIHGNRLLSGKRAVALSPLGTRVLELLAREPGAVLDRQQIIDEIWRGDFLTGDPALNRVISEIRRAVGDTPRDPLLIQTVHRRGYRLVIKGSSADLSHGNRIVGEGQAMAGSRSDLPWRWLLIAVAGCLLVLLVVKLISDEVMAMSGIF